MIKEAIDRILSLSIPNEIEHNGNRFVDKHMERLPNCVTASGLKTSTLSSICHYITKEVDKYELPQSRFIIHVEGPRYVVLYKELNADKKRDCLIEASCCSYKFRFGQFMDLETFLINLQTNFMPNEGLSKLQSFLGSVKNDTSVTQEDDGVSQRVTAKSGISLSRNVTVPNPVMLKPYRTFSEIDQPESAFVFRMRKAGDEIQAALFEADGEAWVNKALSDIYQYFSKHLDHPEDVILLA